MHALPFRCVYAGGVVTLRAGGRKREAILHAIYLGGMLTQHMHMRGGGRGMEEGSAAEKW